jgi:hypothetical protein
MEAKLTNDFIRGAIAAETESAKEKWGERYHSEHEAWAVLKEEIEEANEELANIGSISQVLWNFVRKDKKQDGDKKYIKDNLEYLKEHAQALAIEAVQIAAVTQKYLDTMEEA